MTGSVAPAGARKQVAPAGARQQDACAGMAEIMALAKTFAAARDETETLADTIVAEQRKALRSRLRSLQRRIAEQAAAEEALRAAIEGRPDLFIRPRTVAVEGVKFGLRKQPGAVNVGDEAKAIQRLRDKSPRQADALISVKETLDRKALRKLTAAELAQIGVTVERATDEVTISTGAGHLDKIIDALLADFKPAEAT